MPKLFKSKKPHYEYLRKKWRAKAKQNEQNLFDRHFKNVAMGGLGGLMLLSSPMAAAFSATPYLVDNQPNISGVDDKNRLLATQLLDKVPTEMRPLNDLENQQISDVLSKDLGFKVVPEIDNKRLNRTYGVIGAEQHLYRYPGDNLYGHMRSAEDWAMYGKSGIAPGLGAWGYFAPSKEAFDEKAELRERYYLAVQTFLSPGFSERVAEYRDFYKFRKMLVVNPKTGQAVVAVIGDAGPAEWTGKHLGGSPEVMHIVGYGGGPRKGPVLYYFIDDPEDKVPLGPVTPKGMM